MLSTAAKPVDLAFDNNSSNDDWTPQMPTQLYRTASVGSWGVTSIGRGFDWDENEEQANRRKEAAQSTESPSVPSHKSGFGSFIPEEPRKSPQLTTLPNLIRPAQNMTPSAPPLLTSRNSFQEPASYFALPMSRPASPVAPVPRSALSIATGLRPRSTASSPSIPPRTPGTPRPRRRSSQQRISLVAGRLLIAPFEPPSPVRRLDSFNSILGSAASTQPPSPLPESFLGDRSISDFHIDGEIGRGAYGLVKRVREKLLDGTMGVSSFH